MKIKEVKIHKEFKIGHVPWNKKPDCFITCLVCGKQKKIKWVHQNKAKFCSYKCYWEARKSTNNYPVWNKGVKGFLAGEKHWTYGKKRPEISGNKCHFWKGGISSINKTIRRQIMETLKYKMWRRKVFKRDNYTCVKCQKKGLKIVADHIKRWNEYPELRFKINNGQTLCLECNKIKTGLENKLYWINQYGRRKICVLKR